MTDCLNVIALGFSGQDQSKTQPWESCAHWGEDGGTKTRIVQSESAVAVNPKSPWVIRRHKYEGFQPSLQLLLRGRFSNQFHPDVES